MKVSKPVALIIGGLLPLVVTVSVPQRVQADIIFDLSPAPATTFRGADFGLGQGVSVSQTVTIDGFQFFANLPNGGDANFMIWNGNNSSLLFSQTVTFTASSTKTWIDSGLINFTLSAGSSYFVGIIADNNTGGYGMAYPYVEWQVMSAASCWPRRGDNCCWPGIIGHYPVTVIWPVRLPTSCSI